MAQNVICLVVDRLHSGMLGAYGNSWIRTTALDQLASESFLFDAAFLDSPVLERLYRAWWLGLHAAETRAAEAETITLPRLVASSGLHAALVTDDPQVAAFPWAADFSEHLLVESPPVDEPADDVADTAIARLLGAAGQWLESAPCPFFLWLHAGALGSVWDAPQALRDKFAAEDDPRPPGLVAPPDYWLPDAFDPDEVLGVKHAYAGQIAALDQCLGAWLDQFAASGRAADTQLTLLSARGYPLGEHRRVGPCDEALYNETVQLAWLMRFPDARGKLARSPALVQPHDLPGTLADWLALDRARLGAGNATSLLDVIDGHQSALRDRLLMVSLHDRAIRTPGWHLREPQASAPELYAKPSDRWEVNEVARLVPDVVTGLEAALDELAATGRADTLDQLPEPLATEVD